MSLSLCVCKRPWDIRRREYVCRVLSTILRCCNVALCCIGNDKYEFMAIGDSVKLGPIYHSIVGQGQDSYNNLTPACSTIFSLNLGRRFFFHPIRISSRPAVKPSPERKTLEKRIAAPVSSLKLKLYLLSAKATHTQPC